MNSLIAIPVYNEGECVGSVLDRVAKMGSDVLVIDDGSTDCTPCLLSRRPDVRVMTHTINQGYGKSLIDAFDYAVRADYDVLVTMDADGQHDPDFVPSLLEVVEHCDIASGSRYLDETVTRDAAPEDRRRINRIITQRLNRELGLELTDAFCGFKAYRTSALRKLRITETGYAMPLQFWVQAARAGLVIREAPVPRIYLDLTRAFPGPLRNAEKRLAHYHQVIDNELRVVGSC